MKALIFAGAVSQKLTHHKNYQPYNSKAYLTSLLLFKKYQCLKCSRQVICTARGLKTETFPFYSIPSERKRAPVRATKNKNRTEGGLQQQEVRTTRQTVASSNKMPKKFYKPEMGNILVNLLHLEAMEVS